LPNYEVMEKLKSKLKITPEVTNILENMAGRGVPREYMAGFLGVHKSTLDRAIKKNSMLRDVLERGDSKCHVKAWSTFHDKAFGRKPIKDKNGNIVEPGWEPSDQLIKFWMETRGGLMRKQGIELTGPNGGAVQVREQTEDELRTELEEVRKITK
jgi:hypothetical protein